MIQPIEILLALNITSYDNKFDQNVACKSLHVRVRILSITLVTMVAMQLPISISHLICTWAVVYTDRQTKIIF